MSLCANSDVQFSYVEQVKPEPSDLTSQEASEVSLQELKEMAPNQKVNMYAILSMTTKEPNKVETKSSQALSVKEDCISEDNTTMMELHIWERFYQGSKFLSTNRNTTYSEETTNLEKLVGPQISTNPDREIAASEIKCCQFSHI